MSWAEAGRKGRRDANAEQELPELGMRTAVDIISPINSYSSDSNSSSNKGLRNSCKLVHIIGERVKESTV